MTAFSPVHTIANQIGEMVRLHDPMGEIGVRCRVLELLDLVSIAAPDQRAMIAVAWPSHTRRLITDEPTTALDVTVQARVLRLIHACNGNSDCR